ncbi:hypothetical protein C7441_112117 [Pseudaminobacter salicylatoxidans]|uniref:Phage ABA sandwich domain-containing protein n=1 Tax=Pseudaminobacter salicylatoxidans TaxID=93369 RepID=A0A316BZQ6_PSESE|nr:hypothetical protein [Pseudaminobacter salicylatoxidans]PWJ80575.1 hypothetical protein C7441_112117 [Pseudaminobacter salicylatoxidans]
MTADLIARLEKLTAPDREVDRIIDHLVCWPNEVLRNLEISIRDEWDVPAYTASLDAAVALVGRVRPGWGWGRAEDGYMQLYQPDTDYVVEAIGATPAIALLLALLRSLEAEGARDD